MNGSPPTHTEPRCPMSEASWPKAAAVRTAATLSPPSHRGGSTACPHPPQIRVFILGNGAESGPAPRARGASGGCSRRAARGAGEPSFRTPQPPLARATRGRGRLQRNAIAPSAREPPRMRATSRGPWRSCVSDARSSARHSRNARSSARASRTRPPSRDAAPGAVPRQRGALRASRNLVLHQIWLGLYWILRCEMNIFWAYGICLRSYNEDYPLGPGDKLGCGPYSKYHCEMKSSFSWFKSL